MVIENPVLIYYTMTMILQSKKKSTYYYNWVIFQSNYFQGHC